MAANSWEGGGGGSLVAPAAAGQVAGANGADGSGDSPDVLMTRLVDAVVDRLEERVIEELERRGRRQSWTAF